MGSIMHDKVTGYSHFSSYFINGEKGSLTDTEISEADEFMKRLRLEYGQDADIVSAEEGEFFGYPEYGGKLGSLVSYNVLYTKKLGIPDAKQKLKKPRKQELFV